MKCRSLLVLFIAIGIIACTPPTSESPATGKLRALIIDGENNHGVWPKTTMMIKYFLEETGLMEVEIARTHYTWQGPHFDKMEEIDTITDLLRLYPLAGHTPEPVIEPVPDPNYAPQFDKYDVVLTNFGWKASTWSDGVKRAFESYMANGGGFVVIHAANNSFGDWDEYNKMIGVGGWGGRSETEGYYMYYDSTGSAVRDPTPGPCGSHGAQHEYVVTTREADHPIMKGLPATWLHTKDELYDRMRGPAENMTILATAYSGIQSNGPPWNANVTGTGRHEPMLSTIEYGKGRVFHTVMGHMDYSMECVGFITTLQRGTEWAASGAVTQAVPVDFPDDQKSKSRPWKR